MSTADNRHYKFCFVLPPSEYFSPESGGAIATVTREIAESLINGGDKVVILTPDDGTPMFPVGRVVRLRYGKSHQLARYLGAIGWRVSNALNRHPAWLDPYRVAVWLALRSADPSDVVIVANDSPLAWSLGRDGRRVVLWLHNQLVGPEGGHLDSLPSSVSLVSVSDWIRQWTAERIGVLPSTITVIHNGVNLEEFRPDGSLMEAHGTVRIISHGRIDPNKGHDIVAKAVRMLHERGIKAQLTIVGGVQAFGSPEAVVQEHVRCLREEVEAVGGTMTGRLPHAKVAEVLRQHDIACFMPRTPDPFPLATLEAMASGCAVVVHPTGGLDEMVGDAAERVGEAAPDELAAALEMYISDPPRLIEARKAARQRAEQFSWVAAADQLRDVVRLSGA